MTYYIERSIDIDAGHRVPTHGSKCKAIHGHRWKIVAGCGLMGQHLQEQGEQTGMVMDFGFLKQEMMNAIHVLCDHAFIAWVGDPLARAWVEADGVAFPLLQDEISHVGLAGCCRLSLSDQQIELYLMGAVPTAENLAAHWYARLAPRIDKRSNGAAILKRLTVHETPNSMAVYEPA